MYIRTIINRRSKPNHALMVRFQENGKDVRRPLANISNWPPNRVEALRRVLRGDFDRRPGD
jgi:hypothetical protein